MIRLTMNDFNNAVDGDGDQDEGKTEQQDQGNFAFGGHVRLEHDGYGKGNQKQVGDDVAGAHGDELGVSLTTLCARVGQYLPVMIKGLAFGKSGNDDRGKGDGQEPSDELQYIFVALSPDLAGQALEEFGDGELCDPKTWSSISGWKG